MRSAVRRRSSEVAGGSGEDEEGSEVGEGPSGVVLLAHHHHQLSAGQQLSTRAGPSTANTLTHHNVTGQRQVGHTSKTLPRSAKFSPHHVDSVTNNTGDDSKTKRKSASKMKNLKLKLLRRTSTGEASPEVTPPPPPYETVETTPPRTREQRGRRAGGGLLGSKTLSRSMENLFKRNKTAKTYSIDIGEPDIPVYDENHRPERLSKATSGHPTLLRSRSLDALDAPEVEEDEEVDDAAQGNQDAPVGVTWDEAEVLRRNRKRYPSGIITNGSIPRPLAAPPPVPVMGAATRRLRSRSLDLSNRKDVQVMLRSINIENDDGRCSEPASPVGGSSEGGALSDSEGNSGPRLDVSRYQVKSEYMGSAGRDHMNGDDVETEGRDQINSDYSDFSDDFSDYSDDSSFEGTASGTYDVTVTDHVYGNLPAPRDVTNEDDDDDAFIDDVTASVITDNVYGNVATAAAARRGGGKGHYIPGESTDRSGDRSGDLTEDRAASSGPPSPSQTHSHRPGKLTMKGKFSQNETDTASSSSRDSGPGGGQSANWRKRLTMSSLKPKTGVSKGPPSAPPPAPPPTSAKPITAKPTGGRGRLGGKPRPQGPPPQAPPHATSPQKAPPITTPPRVPQTTPLMSGRERALTMSRESSVDDDDVNGNGSDVTALQMTLKQFDVIISDEEREEGEEEEQGNNKDDRESRGGGQREGGTRTDECEHRHTGISQVIGELSNGGGHKQWKSIGVKNKEDRQQGEKTEKVVQREEKPLLREKGLGTGSGGVKLEQGRKRGSALWRQRQAQAKLEQQGGETGAGVEPAPGGAPKKGRFGEGDRAEKELGVTSQEVDREGGKTQNSTTNIGVSKINRSADGAKAEPPPPGFTTSRSRPGLSVKDPDVVSSTSEQGDRRGEDKTIDKKFTSSLSLLPVNSHSDDVSVQEGTDPPCDISGDHIQQEDVVVITIPVHEEEDSLHQELRSHLSKLKHRSAAAAPVKSGINPGKPTAQDSSTTITNTSPVTATRADMKGHRKNLALPSTPPKPAGLRGRLGAEAASSSSERQQGDVTSLARGVDDSAPGGTACHDGGERAPVKKAVLPPTWRPGQVTSRGANYQRRTGTGGDGSRERDAAEAPSSVSAHGQREVGPSPAPEENLSNITAASRIKFPAGAKPGILKPKPNVNTSNKPYVPPKSAQTVSRFRAKSSGSADDRLRSRSSGSDRSLSPGGSVDRYEDTAGPSSPVFSHHDDDFAGSPRQSAVNSPGLTASSAAYIRSNTPRGFSPRSPTTFKFNISGPNKSPVSKVPETESSDFPTYSKVNKPPKTTAKVTGMEAGKVTPPKVNPIEKMNKSASESNLKPSQLKSKTSPKSILKSAPKPSWGESNPQDQNKSKPSSQIKRRPTVPKKPPRTFDKLRSQSSEDLLTVGTAEGQQGDDIYDDLAVGGSALPSQSQPANPSAPLPEVDVFKPDIYDDIDQLRFSVKGDGSETGGGDCDIPGSGTVTLHHNPGDTSTEDTPEAGQARRVETGRAASLLITQINKSLSVQDNSDNSRHNHTDPDVYDDLASPTTTHSHVVVPSNSKLSGHTKSTADSKDTSTRRHHHLFSPKGFSLPSPKPAPTSDHDTGATQRPYRPRQYEEVALEESEPEPEIADDDDGTEQEESAKDPKKVQGRDKETPGSKSTKISVHLNPQSVGGRQEGVYEELPGEHCHPARDVEELSTAEGPPLPPGNRRAPVARITPFRPHAYDEVCMEDGRPGLEGAGGQDPPAPPVKPLSKFAQLMKQNKLNFSKSKKSDKDENSNQTNTGMKISVSAPCITSKDAKPEVVDDDDDDDDQSTSGAPTADDSVSLGSTAESMGSSMGSTAEAEMADGQRAGAHSARSARRLVKSLTMDELLQDAMTSRSTSADSISIHSAGSDFSESGELKMTQMDHRKHLAKVNQKVNKSLGARHLSKMYVATLKEKTANLKEKTSTIKNLPKYISKSASNLQQASRKSLGDFSGQMSRSVYCQRLS